MHSNSQLRYFDTGTHTFFTYATDNPDHLNRQPSAGSPKPAKVRTPNPHAHARDTIFRRSTADTPRARAGKPLCWRHPAAVPRARARMTTHSRRSAAVTPSPACVIIPPYACVGLYVSKTASRFPPMPSRGDSLFRCVPYGVRPACLHPVCHAVRPCRFCAYCGGFRWGAFGWNQGRTIIHRGRRLMADACLAFR